MVLPSSFITHYAKNTMVNNQYIYNKNYVMALSNSLDISLQKIWNKAYAFVSYDSYDEIGKIISCNTTYQYAFSYNSTKLLSKLISLFSTESLVDEAFIFFPETNFLISTQGSFEGNDYFNKFYSYKNYPLEYWYQTIHTNKFMDLLPAIPVTKIITLPIVYVTNVNVFPMVFHSKLNSHKSILVININEKQVFNIIKEFELPYNSFIHIVDLENNTIICSTNPSSAGLEFDISVYDFYPETESKEAEIKLDGITYLATYQKSTFGNLCYVVLVPKRELVNPINKFLVFTILIILSFMLVGVLFSTVFTNRIYSPLAKIVEYIKNVICIAKNEHTDDYAFIKGTITELYEQQQRITPFIRQVIIHRAIHGELQNVHKEMINYSTLLEYSEFCFVIICIEFSIVWDGLSTSKKESIMNKFKTILSTIYSSTLPISNNKFAVLLNATNSNTLNKVFQDLLTSISDFLKENSEFLKIIIGRSNIFNNLSGCKEYYSQAYNVLDNYDISIEKLYYDERDTVEEHSCAKILTNYEKKVLISYLENGSDKEINDFLSSFFSKLKNEKIPFYKYKKILNELIIILFDMTVSNKIDLSSFWTADRDIFSYISEIRTVSTLEEFWIKSYTLAARYIKSENEETSLIKYICEYIQKNIDTVYLNGLADKLNMSPNYLSQYFKKHSGTTFTNYVNQLRIDTAKELLLNTELTIKRIGKTVGFNNQNVFIRMFRKYEGITPSEYRKRHLKLYLQKNNC